LPSAYVSGVFPFLDFASYKIESLQIFVRDV